MKPSVYTADRRLYLNTQGAVVEATDPTRVELLVNIGGQISLADAQKYGLIEADPTDVDALAVATDETQTDEVTGEGDKSLTVENKAIKTARTK